MTLDPSNLAFAEELYENYLRDPASVDPAWRDYFQENGAASASWKSGPSFTAPGLFSPREGGLTPVQGKVSVPFPAATGPATANAVLQDRVDQLIRAYRNRGHLAADINPLHPPEEHLAALDPVFYGLSEETLEMSFSSGSMAGPKVQTLREILGRLRNTYASSIGVQFTHIDDLFIRRWLQEKMEGSENRAVLSREEQLRILQKLTDATLLEEFIQKKFIGAKSFSLEGAETLIPLLDLALEKAAELQVEDVVIAMAHRGRLNVLANTMGKNPRAIFREFQDMDAEKLKGRGDVKYHLGYSSDHISSSGWKLHLSLCFNPSHLEIVNPVALGRVRAKQDRAGDSDRTRGLAILIHGDSAFAGEGIGQETLNLSQLKAYSTGGTLHVVVNNQIGFTTQAEQNRSSTYATDIAKMLDIPVFHVNGENPEAVAQVLRLALEFRRRFKRDVVIDMYAYRKRGHNEADEPAFTQPVQARAIASRPTVREGYLDHLLRLGQVSREEADAIAEQRLEHLEKELVQSKDSGYKTDSLAGLWKNFRGGPDPKRDPATGVPRKKLSELLESLTHYPENFHPHPKILRILEGRREMAAGSKALDWAAGEALAFASLALEGHRVRLTGQDSERGTFSHRHAVLHDAEDGHTHRIFEGLSRSQEAVEIANSPLSELAVLAYEYGYSLDWPDGLVAWEAQFGDFANMAQPIVDQFLVSGEEKWQRLSGLTLLLPHGLEGMGPEHSSARLERYLNLGAEENIRVAVPSTPAQIFHLLRRQVKSPVRKPLFVMSPKSLLRHPQAVSSLEELASGHFQRLISDEKGFVGRTVKKVLLCSGRLYYDLAQKRAELKREDVAILRLEQLYPLDFDLIEERLSAYPKGTPVAWVQDEPQNMGAWNFLRLNFRMTMFEKWPLSGIYRARAASPATGSPGSHKKEQAEILDKAFKL